MTDRRTAAGWIVRTTDGVNALGALLCHALLAVIVAVTTLQVLLRYAFNSPTKWSDELSMFCLVWFGMIAVAIGVRRHWHIAITYLRDKAPARIARALDIFALLALLAFALVLVLNALQLSALTGRAALPASGIPKSWLYHSVLAGGLLMALNVCVTLLFGVPESDSLDTPEAAAPTDPETTHD
ncbi:TRAP transporter small permease [Salipiger mangrovisoli]|uniref:TRAP transporter small permease protein n=1 Tax=Salipiger mangrovisoli TaxID=2865933 RepID=A0ABR9XAR5_9RHOB|nr:TRAP transporter small permease [Salipiger mangrovisoli]MBE9640593.1 TRAP transporter small permease [Salipiger mangrovisoli]